MKSKRLYLLLVSSIFSFFPALSQDRRIDSLRFVLSNAKEDTNKIMVLISLNNALVLQNSADTSQYAHQAWHFLKNYILQKGWRIHIPPSELPSILNRIIPKP